MALIKVAEATGPALDWLVAKCEGYETAFTQAEDVTIFREGIIDYFDPHRNWGWGGPIIERIKGFEFKHWLDSKPESCCEVHIHNYDGDWVAFGPTPLIAAMRCYCCSKLGDVVDIPEELCQQQNS